MKIKNLLSIAITIFLLFTSKQSVKAQTGVYSPSLVNFDVAMTNLLNDFDIPGGQLAITYQGRLVYSRGFGFADESTSTAVCPNSIFRMASLSKQITAITIMHLYEQGRVGLNDLVFGPNGILPEPIYQTILDTRVYNIKVKHLLSHQGGWDRDISGDPEHNSYAIALAMSVPPPANNETIIQYTLSQQMLDFTPGSSAAYSNLGFNILGEVIEKITNQDYETYVRDTILAPLGITDMHSAKSLLVNKYPNEVNYYDYPGAPLVPSVFNNNILGPMQYGGSKCHMEVRAAGGGWVASAQDLCKLLCAVDLYPTKPDILLPTTINTMVQPVHSYLGSPYALGWYINTTDNNWFHTGLLHGTMTFQCRRNDSINYALLVNSRPNLYSAQYTALNDLVRSIVPLITSWPTFDLFDSTVVCSPLSSVNNISQNPSLFTVYPNPSNGKFTANFEGLQQANCKLSICNLLGQEIYTTFFKGQQSTLDIDLSDFSKGLYFVKVDDGKNSYTQKIITE
jgi:CubicO group peptidase (beta-lactamase class C family)